jgi:indolepyruvate ferredoxin oxidoreductase beta subunit
MISRQGDLTEHTEAPLKPAIDVLMVGVGGQGIVLAGDILAEAALLAGFEVKKSDALGMAQRGGSVVAHVRLGPRVYSPLIKRGSAHLLLGFEKLEAARWAAHLRHQGLALVNDQAIPPLSVSSGAEAYPSDEAVMQSLRCRTNRVYLVRGLALAEELGSARALNSVMLGLASPFLPLGEEVWEHCLSQRVPSHLLELNLRAFRRGRQEAEALEPIPPEGATLPAPPLAR